MVVRAPTLLCTFILTVINTLGAKPVDLHHNFQCGALCSYACTMRLNRLNVSYVQGVIKHWDRSWPMNCYNPIIACDIKLRDVISTQVLLSSSLAGT